MILRINASNCYHSPHAHTFSNGIEKKKRHLHKSCVSQVLGKSASFQITGWLIQVSISLVTFLWRCHISFTWTRAGRKNDQAILNPLIPLLVPLDLNCQVGDSQKFSTKIVFCFQDIFVALTIIGIILFKKTLDKTIKELLFPLPD